MAAGIGTVIRRQRGALGLTQSTLARHAGVSQAYVSQLEAGTRRAVSVGILRRLADALGVSMTDLLEKETSAMPRRGRTEIWLYQMRQGPNWGPQDFAREVREGRLLSGHWDESDRRVHTFGGKPPQPGDLMVLFWVLEGADAPGLCGFGVITEFGENRQLRFRALPPTRTLQDNPRWTPRIRDLVDDIRRVAQDTMWRVREVRHVKGLFAEIFRELDEGWLGEWMRTATVASTARGGVR